VIEFKSISQLIDQATKEVETWKFKQLVSVT
jgi:hypothetical protein